jgi:hypothetical protein
MDQNIINSLTSLLHLSGMVKVIVGGILGGAGIWGFLSSRFKLIQKARNTITTTMLFLKDVQTMPLSDQQKTDFNAMVDSYCDDISGIKFLADKIPLLQKLKLAVDEHPSTATSTTK